jgi:hypothetical protein
MSIDIDRREATGGFEGLNPHWASGYSWELRKTDEKVSGPGRRSLALDCQPVTQLNNG